MLSVNHLLPLPAGSFILTWPTRPSADMAHQCQESGGHADMWHISARKVADDSRQKKQ